MDWKPFITVDPRSITHGAVCFEVLHSCLGSAWDNLADGATPEEILGQYPGLRPEHIPAALGYVADLARERAGPSARLADR